MFPRPLPKDLPKLTDEQKALISVNLMHSEDACHWLFDEGYIDIAAAKRIIESLEAAIVQYEHRDDEIDFEEFGGFGQD